MVCGTAHDSIVAQSPKTNFRHLNEGRISMPKYLLHGSYTVEGVKGVIKDGGTGRKDAVKQLLESVGGKLEAMYFAFGKDDWYIIADLPDPESAVAIAATTVSSGAVDLQTTVLLTPEQIDAGMKKAVKYRRPGA